MSQFPGLLRHEFAMSIRRPGLWIAFGLLFAFHSFLLLTPTPVSEIGQEEVIRLGNLWQYAGRFVLQFNLFLPVVAGILASDRMQRDFRLGVRELQNSAPVHTSTYVLGKYFGVLFSIVLPVFLWLLALSAALVLTRQAPVGMLYAMPVAFLAMTAPAFAFVTAFSLACPLIMPVRVYQILFTGYWFWGNFLNPKVLPTLAGTLLTPSGEYAYQGFFGGYPGAQGQVLRTPLEATLNLIVLGLC